MRLRVLLVADTHLGFDAPERARISRRRRGPDFFASFEAALAPALRGEVDLVVHGGDLLYRSRVPAKLVAQAVEPMRAVADSGVPVLIVPGNHERSQLPFPILAAHRNLHVFDRPRTFTLELRGERVAVGGFPYARQVRSRFPALVAETGLLGTAAGLRLLCLHHAVEGARVAHFTFRDADDVIRGSDLPTGVAAFLSGHIHRGQVLRRDLGGRPFPAPFLYPGSVERTSFAEKDESKAFLTIDFEDGAIAGWSWHRLPARPMVEVELPPGGPDALWRRLQALPPDAVVRIRLPDGSPTDLTAQRLRELAPSSMNVELGPVARGVGRQPRESGI